MKVLPRQSEVSTQIPYKAQELRIPWLVCNFRTNRTNHAGKVTAVDSAPHAKTDILREIINGFPNTVYTL